MTEVKEKEDKKKAKENVKAKTIDSDDEVPATQTK